MPVLTPEQKARQQIDEMLRAAGWQVQTRQGMNRAAAPGVAVCEFPLTSGAVDYLLFADGRPIGVVEAKKAGTPLSGVEPQARKYCEGLPEMLRPLAWHDPLPFRYESTGVETFFADDRDPDARSRRVFTFHRPETLVKWAGQGKGDSRIAPTGTARIGTARIPTARTGIARTGTAHPPADVEPTIVGAVRGPLLRRPLQRGLTRREYG